MQSVKNRPLHKTRQKQQLARDTVTGSTPLSKNARQREREKKKDRKERERGAHDVCVRQPSSSSMRECREGILLAEARRGK